MRHLALPLLALIAGCHEAPPARTHRARETAASMSAEAIPAANAQGTLGGRPFTLRTAWLRAVRRVGHERVDLVLSEGRPSRLCGRPTPNDARHIVVRFTGVTEVPAGAHRIDPGAQGREVFAEAPGEHGIEAVGGGSALLIAERPDGGDGVFGRVRVCLPDAHGSCVAGAFRAQVCWDELDLDGPRGARDRAGDGGAR